MSKDKFVKVKSSTIQEVKYDPVTKALDVIFKSGGHYSYSGVSEEKYNSMISAKSVGSYFHSNIKGKHSAIKH